MDQNTENVVPGDPEPEEDLPLIDPFDEPEPVAEEEPAVEAEVVEVSETGDSQPLEPEIIQTSSQSSSNKSTNGWVIALIVFLVVCCCCIVLFVPLVFFTGIFASLAGSVYSLVIDILNSIFGGMIQFY